MNFQIKNYTSKYRNELLFVWEKSVLATHHFLKPTDFIEIKEMVQNFDFDTFIIYCLTDNNKVIGFISLQNVKIEMLFLDPEYIGKGLGNKLIMFAISNFKINLVDVNEQNTNAKNFYEKLGFETFERTEKDNSGKDYPLLKMRLRNIK